MHVNTGAAYTWVKSAHKQEFIEKLRQKLRSLKALKQMITLWYLQYEFEVTKIFVASSVALGLGSVRLREFVKIFKIEKP